MSRAAELRSYSEVIGNRDGKGIKLMATEGCGEARRWTFSCPTLTRWQEWCGVMLRERDRDSSCKEDAFRDAFEDSWGRTMLRTITD